MFCSQCGHSNPDGAVFCNKCGQRMPAPGAPAGPAEAQASPPERAGIPPAGATPQAIPPEKLVWEGAMSWRGALNAWWLLGFLLLVPGVIAGLVLSLGLAWWVLAPLALVPVVAFGIVVWVKRSTHYRITSERITVMKGIVSRSSDDIQLIRVEDVQFYQGLLHRLLGVGTIRVLSTDKGSPDLLIEGVLDPPAFKEMLWHLVRERRRNLVPIEQLNY